MILYHQPDFLDPFDHAALLASAKGQDFLTEDPEGRDDVQRNGNRPNSEVVFKWDGFDRFWELARPRISPLALSHFRLGLHKPHHVELTRMLDGSFFQFHQDTDESGGPTPRVSFVYYLGDVESFSGGELTFGDVIVRPTNNSLAMYASTEIHGVRQMKAPATPHIETQRLTINGYFA